MGYTHDDVARAWARGAARPNNGHNVYHDGTTIYSYGSHYPIAYRDSTNGVIWFNDRSYSTSTSKHCSIVRRHIPSRATVRDVCNPHIFRNSTGRTPAGDLTLAVQKECDYQLRKAKAYADKLKRARVHGDIYAAQAWAYLNTYKLICQIVGEPVDVSLETLEDHILVLRAQREFARAGGYSPE